MLYLLPPPRPPRPLHQHPRPPRLPLQRLKRARLLFRPASVPRGHGPAPRAHHLPLARQHHPLPRRRQPPIHRARPRPPARPCRPGALLPRPWRRRPRWRRWRGREREPLNEGELGARSRQPCHLPQLLQPGHVAPRPRHRPLAAQLPHRARAAEGARALLGAQLEHPQPRVHGPRARHARLRPPSPRPLRPVKFHPHPQCAPRAARLHLPGVPPSYHHRLPLLLATCSTHAAAVPRGGGERVREHHAPHLAPLAPLAPFAHRQHHHVRYLVPPHVRAGVSLCRTRARAHAQLHHAEIQALQLHRRARLGELPDPTPAGRRPTAGRHHHFKDVSALVGCDRERRRPLLVRLRLRPRLRRCHHGGLRLPHRCDRSREQLPGLVRRPQRRLLRRAALAPRCGGAHARGAEDCLGRAHPALPGEEASRQLHLLPLLLPVLLLLAPPHLVAPRAALRRLLLRLSARAARQYPAPAALQLVEQVRSQVVGRRRVRAQPVFAQRPRAVALHRRPCAPRMRAAADFAPPRQEPLLRLRLWRLLSATSTAARLPEQRALLPRGGHPALEQRRGRHWHAPKDPRHPNLFGPVARARCRSRPNRQGRGREGRHDDWHRSALGDDAPPPLADGEDGGDRGARGGGGRREEDKVPRGRGDLDLDARARLDHRLHLRRAARRVSAALRPAGDARRADREGVWAGPLRRARRRTQWSAACPHGAPPSSPRPTPAPQPQTRCAACPTAIRTRAREQRARHERR